MKEGFGKMSDEELVKIVNEVKSILPSVNDQLIKYNQNTNLIMDLINNLNDKINGLEKVLNRVEARLDYIEKEMEEQKIRLKETKEVAYSVRYKIYIVGIVGILLGIFFDKSLINILKLF